MKQSFQFVLFDLEGTLVDFQWNLASAASETRAELVRMGFDPSAWENHYAALRNNAVSQAEQIGLDKRAVANRIGTIYDRYDLDAAKRWSLMPGVKSLLPDLNARNIKLGLVTNIGKRAVGAGLARLSIAGCFDVIVTRNDVELVKPNGAGIRFALEKLGARNSDALFVGDSVSDILAAQEAGVRVAIVQGGESAPTSLIAARPDHLWQSLDELKSLFAGVTQPGVIASVARQSPSDLGIASSAKTASSQ
jgi:HAD superfamily hydrolase (TIGR01509 family)